MMCGMPECYARRATNSRERYWRPCGTTTVKRAITKERGLLLAVWFDLVIVPQDDTFQSVRNFFMKEPELLVAAA